MALSGRLTLDRFPPAAPATALNVAIVTARNIQVTLVLNTAEVAQHRPQILSGSADLPLRPDPEILISGVQRR